MQHVAEYYTDPSPGENGVMCFYGFSNLNSSSACRLMCDTTRRDVHCTSVWCDATVARCSSLNFFVTLLALHGARCTIAAWLHVHCMQLSSLCARPSGRSPFPVPQTATNAPHTVHIALSRVESL